MRATFAKSMSDRLSIGTEAHPLNSTVPANIVNAIRSNPEHFYIDVHGQGLQFGAVRGQLF